MQLYIIASLIEHALRKDTLGNLFFHARVLNSNEIFPRIQVLTVAILH